MELSDEQIDACFDGLMPSGSGKSRYDIARAIEAEVRRQDEALIRQLVEALDSVRVFWQQHTQADALSMTMAELHDDVELVIRAARGAAQAAPVDATTWQPIATAPKDGKAILLRSKNGRIADGLWSAANSRTGFWAWAYVHQEPAEWMPKPGSPAARAQEQQP